MLKVPAESTSRNVGSELAAVVRRSREVWSVAPARDRRVFLTALALILFTGASINAIPVLLGELIDAMQASQSRGQIDREWAAISVWYLTIIAIVSLLRESCQSLRKYLVQRACTRIEKSLTVGVVSHLLREDLTSLSREQVGAFHGRVTRSVEGFVHLLKLAFMDFFPAVFTVLTALGYALYRNSLVGLVMVGTVPCTLAIVGRQLTLQRDLRLRSLRSRETLDGTVVEQLGGIEYIRAANMFDQEIQRVVRVAEARRENDLRLGLFTAAFDGLKAINDWMFQLGVLGLAIYLAMTGKIALGDILVFSYLFYNVIVPLKDVQRLLDESHESGLQLDDLMKAIDEVLDESFAWNPAAETTIIRAIDQRRRPPPPTVFREPRLTLGLPVFTTDRLVVDYWLGEGGKRRILNDVSLEIRHGETIGLAGRSGSGKSTLIKVLLRLAHPTSGSVTLGDVPIKAVSREAIGRLTAYVGQTPFIFAGTVAENIAYGCPEADEEAIRRAAERAGIHDEIEAMPGAYQARIDERGQNLSGGQRQRLALARVFLKNTPLLISDEGTSALDNISEDHIQRVIETLRGDHTIILVAHRLSTLRHVDRILVFEDGRVAQEGTYHELASCDGVFTELVRLGQEGVREP